MGVLGLKQGNHLASENKQEKKKRTNSRQLPTHRLGSRPNLRLLCSVILLVLDQISQMILQRFPVGQIDALH